MEINVNVKHIGKRKKSVEPRTYQLLTEPSTVRELILAVVEAGVREYNERLENQESEELLKCLTRREIEEKAESGKVSFGTLYGEEKADLKQAQDNAIQCFEDGLYRIFLDDKALEDLDEELGRGWAGQTGGNCPADAEAEGNGMQKGTFTFVRLTMLSGRMW